MIYFSSSKELVYTHLYAHFCLFSIFGAPTKYPVKNLYHTNCKSMKRIFLSERYYKEKFFVKYRFGLNDGDYFIIQDRRIYVKEYSRNIRFRFYGHFTLLLFLKVLVTDSISLCNIFLFWIQEFAENSLITKNM